MTYRTVQMAKPQLAGNDSSVSQVTRGASCGSTRQLAAQSAHLRGWAASMCGFSARIWRNIFANNQEVSFLSTCSSSSCFAFVELQPSSLVLLLVSTCSGLPIASHFVGVSTLGDNQSWCQLVRPGFHWLLRAGGGRQNMGAAAGAACVWLTYSCAFHRVYNISEPAASCLPCRLPVWTHRCRGGSRQRFGVFKASVWAAKTFA